MNKLNIYKIQSANYKKPKITISKINNLCYIMDNFINDAYADACSECGIAPPTCWECISPAVCGPNPGECAI